MCIRDRYQRRVHGENINKKNLIQHIKFLAQKNRMISKFLVQSQYIQPFMMAQSLFNLSVQSFADAKPKKKARKPKPKVEMPPVNPHQDGDVSQMRSIIASRLTQAKQEIPHFYICLLYTSPSPRDVEESRMPSSA
eukprot:TRINITY_DN20_c0_g1_i2.p1 TRINITY_DN20_c0_g1~~TRINITY_DN20_c0_g1_i2.p1  ORF type:complete len:136 (-),score=67.92 TRINITY_DN20_c0_g1_i2:33-440(-)